VSGQVRRLLLRSLLGRSFDLLFLCPKAAKTGLGLQLGLQKGVTFCKKRGYTFGFLGGMIEGEGKGMF